MPMAPAAVWGAGGPAGLLSSKSRFLPVPSSPNAAAPPTTVVVRLGRCAGVRNRAAAVITPRCQPRGPEWPAGADDPDPYAGMVDEDMATLRRRMREARAALSSEGDDDTDEYDHDDAVHQPLAPVSRWTQLKRWCHGEARLLRVLLVKGRPGLDTGILALLLLLALGVPASVFLVGKKLIQAVDAISSLINNR